MSNKIFDALLAEKIEFFRNSFIKTSEIYFNEKKKLISPLEFGIHKEYACRDFLKFLIPNNFQIDDGFIINAVDEISTQCDIVIFNPNTTPLFESGKRQRFFPMETVLAVGEVKSQMTKYQLKSAINKLAKVKSIRRTVNNPSIISRHPEINDFDNFKHPFDQIFSFIICQKLKFKPSSVDFDLLYDKDIADEDRHNVILSIEDGIFLYRQTVNSKVIPWPYPVSGGDKMKNRFVDCGENSKNHFHLFAEMLFSYSQLATKFTPMFNHYTINSNGTMLEE